MQNTKKKIYLITKEYPLGDKETSFIEPEYEKLVNVFDVTIIVTELDDTIRKNEHISIEINKKLTFFQKILSLLKFLCHKDAWTEFSQIISEKKGNIRKHLFRACMYGTFAEAFYARLRKSINLKKDTEAIFYFYWWDYKCFGLTMHKKKYPNIKVIARTHGYDLYDERELYGRQYFKPQMDRELERLIFVAYYGKQYYLDRYQISDSIKYPVHALGVKNPKVDLNEGIKNEFLLVSCSNAIPLKRIELIIEGLSKIDAINIKWVHIGDGTEMCRLRELAMQKLGSNIEYEFAGRLLNREVIDYYKKHNVNCFITTSSTEGNPVSVQEALSFGIPIIATSVSDIPRMIDGNGVLLSENPTSDEVADAIRKIATTEFSDYIKLRKKSYMIFTRDYDSEKNHEKLIADLLNII